MDCASVGIADAAAYMKRIPLFSRNGELSEKAGFWMPRRQAFRTRKRVARSRWEKNPPGGLDWRKPGVYSQPPGGQRTNPGLMNRDIAVGCVGRGWVRGAGIGT
jgi:hypothetical protein